MNRLRDIFVKYKMIISNFGYLSLVQMFNIVLPLVTYPYLLQVLGTETFGKVIFAQSIVAYFSIIIRFGFDVSATKDISIFRDNPNRLSQVFSSVIIVKALMWFLSFAFLLTMIFFIPEFTKDKWLYIFSFTICFNEFLFPQFFFQGMEQMKFITIINLISRCLFVVLIFVFVNNQNDYLIVPLLNGIGAFIGGVVAMCIVFYKFNVKFRIPSYIRIYFYFKQTIPLFTSQVVIGVKDKASTIFIGMFLGMHEVALFDIGLKFMNVLSLPISIITNVLYPKISKEKNMGLMMKFAHITIGLVLFCIIPIFIFTPQLVEIIGGNEMIAAVPVVRLLLLAPLLLSYSSFFGTNCLCVYGHYKIYMKGMFYTTIFYLLTILVCFYFGWLNNLYTFVVITLLVYFFELVYRFYAVFTRRLVPIINLRYKLFFCNN